MAGKRDNHQVRLISQDTLYVYWSHDCLEDGVGGIMHKAIPGPQDVELYEVSQTLRQALKHPPYMLVLQSWPQLVASSDRIECVHLGFQ